MVSSGFGINFISAKFNTLSHYINPVENKDTCIRSLVSVQKIFFLFMQTWNLMMEVLSNVLRTLQSQSTSCYPPRRCRDGCCTEDKGYHPLGKI
jgi:hypothetical protein